MFSHRAKLKRISNISKHRTESYNKVPDIIYEQTNELRGIKNRKEDSRSENPPFSTRTRDNHKKTHRNTHN